MKTVVVPFTRRLKHNLKEPRMGDVTIKFSEDTKYLGITLYSKLLWNSHMKKTKKKGLDGLQKGCGTEMGPKACDDEMNLPDGRETNGDLRIICMVAVIWRSDHWRNAPKNTKASMPTNYRGYEECPNYDVRNYARPSFTT
jgi:hypothetical protein